MPKCSVKRFTFAQQYQVHVIAKEHVKVLYIKKEDFEVIFGELAQLIKQDALQREENSPTRVNYDAWAASHDPPLSPLPKKTPSEDHQKFDEVLDTERMEQKNRIDGMEVGKQADTSSKIDKEGVNDVKHGKTKELHTSSSNISPSPIKDSSPNKYPSPKKTPSPVRTKKQPDRLKLELPMPTPTTTQLHKGDNAESDVDNNNKVEANFSSSLQFASTLGSMQGYENDFDDDAEGGWDVIHE